MDARERETYCTQQGQLDMQHLGELLKTIPDFMALATLAAITPVYLSRWGMDSPTVRQHFREAVRDRYTELIADQDRHCPSSH